MNNAPPEFRGKSPDQILTEKRNSIASWHVHQTRCWLDYCEREDNVNGLYYAALELRMAIEQLWYSYVITVTHDTITRKKYVQYTRSHAKLRKFMEKVKPHYAKLARFSNLCLKQAKNPTRVIEWDISRLIGAHHELSGYLHFHGIAEETWENDSWLAECKQLLHHTASYLWDELSTGATGAMREETMEPEVLAMWVKFRDGRLSDEDCLLGLEIAGPVFRRRKLFYTGPEPSV